MLLKYSQRGDKLSTIFDFDKGQWVKNKNSCRYDDEICNCAQTSDSNRFYVVNNPTHCIHSQKQIKQISECCNMWNRKIWKLSMHSMWQSFNYFTRKELCSYSITEGHYSFSNIWWAEATSLLSAFPQVTEKKLNRPRWLTSCQWDNTNSTWYSDFNTPLLTPETHKLLLVKGLKSKHFK